MKKKISELTLYTTNDGKLFDLEYFGESVLEFLPATFRVDIGKKSYYVDDDEYLKNCSYKEEITIHLYNLGGPIEKSVVDFD